MQQRELGRSGILTAPLVFGGNVFGWTTDEPTSFRLLDAFVDAGFNMIDTADVYSHWAPGNHGGESETVIGNWLQRSGKRNQVVIATKVGKDMGDGKKGLSARYIRAAMEDSLRRLRTDHIDLYQSHEDDPATPLSKTLGTYADLVKEGKVRAIGASNYSGERLAEALEISLQNAWPRYETLQPLYNLYNREPFEKELEPVCLGENIGVITYSSLASGFLTGKYRSADDLNKSVRGSGMGKFMNERGFRILNALDQVAAQLNTTPAAVSLAWLMARPSVTAPIASATNIAQLELLMSAATLRLDEAAMALLDATC